MPKPTQNGDACKFAKAEQEWDLKRLFDDIEAKQGKKLTPAQQRNLKAILLGHSPKDASPILRVEEKSLKPAFSELCRLIEELITFPHTSVTYRNAPLVLAKYRKGEELQELRSPDFIGRDDEMSDIHNLTAQGAKCILILAPGGTGKTVLAKNYLMQTFGSYIEFPIAKERRNIASVASLVEEKLRQLNEEPGKEFLVSLDRLKRKLQQERIGVLIDNLEPALDGNGQFVEEHRDYIELLRVLTDSSLRSTTLITSRESLNEGLDTQTLMLGGLKAPVWQTFFSQQGINADIPALDEERKAALAEVHKAYGGNALAMKILCDPIKRFHDGDLAAYWQASKTESGLVVEQALENLIREQFDRLQSNFPEVYKLLCRMGCFRYQDVPTVPKEGLISLLWDVSKEKHSRVIISLRNCPLIELDKGEYFLHPVIRAEAISRLRASSEWEETNRKAAEFWTDNVKTIESVKDALTAFEAYYNYLNIGDYNNAGYVIAHERLNISNYHEALGRTFYIFGQLNKTLKAISTIIDFIYCSSAHLLSSLFNILGDIYSSLGIINKAIDTHRKSYELAKEGVIKNYNVNDDNKSKIRTCLINFKRNATYNIAMCYIDIFEYEKAWNLFNELYSSLEKDYKEESESLVTSSGLNYIFILAFLDSHSGKDNVNHEFIDKELIKLKSTGQRWTKGYGLFFLGSTYKRLSMMPKSFEMYNEAIGYAEEMNYVQLKSKVLTGLAELYRSQQNFDKAYSHHKESIRLLDEIGAKCDLAEAYLQLGLTYQADGKHDQAEEYKSKALELFEQMEAPKQIERVKKAFEQGAKK